MILENWNWSVELKFRYLRELCLASSKYGSQMRKNTSGILGHKNLNSIALDGENPFEFFYAK